MTALTRIGVHAFACIAAVGMVWLAGCSGGTGGDSVVVEGDVPIAYVKRVNTFRMNPVNGATGAPGGDLMIREKSSPSAPEHNITSGITQGVGDVSDPEVSYDGRKIVFAMRCPRSNAATVGNPPQPACTGRWNIWEYTLPNSGFVGGTFRRITSSTERDDVDPVYLPAGRGFVFVSNRQTKSYVNQALGHSYYARDEYEREEVFNLHTMDADGNNIQQISFNASHDRNPVVRPDGDIMYSRWDHIGNRNQFTIFRCKPDGTDLFVLYGAHSTGNSFLHPRDMDPSGPYKGFVTTDLMPLLRTYEGGALEIVDAANYSEENTPANTSVPSQGGQQQMTSETLSIERGLSRYGRVTTPYPLWDGTNRILVAYTPCLVRRNGVVVSCATLSQEDIDRLNDQNRLIAEVAADPLQDDVPPSYAIYMFDPVNQTWRIVAAPPPGFMLTDPVPLQARTEPNAINPTNVDADLAAQGLALIEIRSVYDTDDLGRMGNPVLSDVDVPSGQGCGPIEYRNIFGVRDPSMELIPKIHPEDPLDTRQWVPDLVRMKTPTDPAYRCAPARFIRAVRAVPPPSNVINTRYAIGQTNFEMQQILGYAAVEPDGSFKLKVPADVPVALSVVDEKGRAFQVHTNWIQARPGERRTCDGCHGLRRGGALNSGTIVNAMPAGLNPTLAGAHLSGETMASTRGRLDAAVLGVFPDLVFEDTWADTSQPGVVARSSINIRYADLATPAPSNGIINYPEHIQPLWTRSRSGGACVDCHSDPSKLDLRDTEAGTGRYVSYEKLMVGAPEIDPNTRLPVFRVQNGVLVLARVPALVNTSASNSDAVGMARKSRLMEILSGDRLMADAEDRGLYPDPQTAGGPDHSQMLTAAEQRLLAEWMDVGGEYFNDPYDSASRIREITMLDEDVFRDQVFPILQSTCAASCHQGAGGNPTTPPATSFDGNRYVLTGDLDGDYGVTLTMINDVCSPETSPLLSQPSTIPSATPPADPSMLVHPADPLNPGLAVLPAGSANYNVIRDWIRNGQSCP